VKFHKLKKKGSSNQKLLSRCNKKCSNRNRKSKRFCKKCLSLDIISEYNNSSVILLSNSTKFDFSKIENLIVFGDSHSAVNTNFTDMSYTGVNHSGGKNWPLYMIELNKNMNLWNFAVGGSYIDEKLVKMWQWYKIDLKGQFNLFHEKMSKDKTLSNSWNKYNSLYALWIGNNDIRNLYGINVTK